MGMKILHSADWHLDSPFASFPEPQREFLRRELGEIPGKIAGICRRESCDLVLLAGDIFDGKPGRETIDTLKTALAACKVPVCISPGNHDFCVPGSPWLEESWPENVHVFTGGLESVGIPELDCRVYGAGYRSMDCESLLENFRAEGNEKYCVAVLHGDPTGKKSPYNPVTAAQVRDSGLDYLALGHIHKAGAFRAGGTLCAWPGCPMGRGWDETGEKGLCIVTIGDTAEVKMMPLDTVCFHEMEWDVAEDLDAGLPPVGNNDFYRIILTGCGSVDTAALKRQLIRFPNLELQDRTEAPIDLWADVGEDTLRGVYFKLLLEKSEKDPRARQAAEVSRRLLAGREVRLP